MMSVIRKTSKKASSTGKSSAAGKSTAKKASSGRATVSKSSTKSGVSSRKATTMKRLSNDEILAMISAKAYEYFESRGYSHGNDLGDWYAAEEFVIAALKK